MGARHGKPKKPKVSKSVSAVDLRTLTPVKEIKQPLTPPATPQWRREERARLDKSTEISKVLRQNGVSSGNISANVSISPLLSSSKSRSQLTPPLTPSRSRPNRSPPSTPSKSRSTNSSTNNLAHSLRSKLIATHSYDACQEDEISFKKGDRMEIVTDSENPDWYLVRHDGTGVQGYIPANFVTVGSNTVKAKDWWCPLDRGDAERTLLNPLIGKGTFLVRERQDSQSPYALSVKDSPLSVKHYKIQVTASGAFYIKESDVFTTLEVLLEFYSTRIDSGLCCLLAEPCPKAKPLVPFRHMELSRDQIKLIRKIGDGYYGEVWVGRMNNNEDVAVKMMKRGRMTSQKFIEEARMMNRLEHPKLVRLRGVCTLSRPMMIITEFMVKGDLLKYLRNDRGKSVKLPHLVDIASQIASGMNYLESCNYIHRDLRAANVLVGDNNIVKIADFGLARIVLSDEETYIMSNQSKVPIKWTAPESLLYQEFTIKSDVWSYGILLFELFTYGKVPYSGVSSTCLLMTYIRSGYRMSKPPGVLDEVYGLMLRCWNETPEKRPTFAYIYNYFEDFPNVTENRYRELLKL